MVLVDVIAGLPQQLQDLDVDPLGMEVPPQKFDVIPCHLDIIRLQPDALLVADGQLADAQVAPDIAAQAL